ncbi:MAG: hypothetical protein J7L63_03915 [Thermoplasmata archaeon]|nr:hypothetical protein [Thermoplasmata archaeon]
MNVKRACELLKVPRSRVYYKRKGESREDLELMKQIEEIYNKDPTIGYRRMKAMLEKVTRKVATRPNQVWVSDITYIRVEEGTYGVFIMDMHSRKILLYEISDTMGERMCVAWRKR